ncbi:Hypothetical protein RMP42_06015 [Roseomonas mucosa]|nr:Hypothetical protein RMP42_06015 [Roseomonas mucosa]
MSAMALALSKAGVRGSSEGSDQTPPAERLQAAALHALDHPTQGPVPEVRADPRQAARLQDAGVMAIRQNRFSWDGARDALRKQVRNDPDLLWEMLRPMWQQVSQQILTAAAAKHRAQELGRQTMMAHPVREAVRQPEKTHRNAAIAAVAAVAAQSILDTFKIGGTPIGDLTPRVANAWASRNEARTKFVRALTQNLPPDEPIRKRRSASDAEALRAQILEGGSND